jgi:exonuclease III
MIVESLNVRGVGGSLKSLTLTRFLEKNKPDVLFIQETMVGAAKAREVFYKLLPNWNLCGVDSIGLSGGLLSAWNPIRMTLMHS